MIKPTVGRILWYFSGGEYCPEKAAIVTGVHGDRMVNLCVFDDSGAVPHPSIWLVQPNDERPTGEYCSWMPYQTKKAFGSESGEQAAGAQSI